MTAAAPHDASLLPVPDLAAQLRRDWPRIALRAAVAVLVPLFTALAVDAFGIVTQLRDYVPVIRMLQPGTDDYAMRVVAFLTLILVLASFLLKQRTGAVVLGIASAVALGASFNHSRLHWSKLFDLGDYSPDAPTALAWTWVIALLATAVAFVLGESHFDTRRHQEARALLEAETRAVARIGRQGALLALAGGAALVGTLLGLTALLAPAVLERGALPRLNPVFVMLTLGILIALAVIASARRARIEEPREAPPQPPARRL